MAKATVLALAAALIVLGILQYVPATSGANAGLGWIVSGIVALIVGWLTQSMK